MCHSVMAPERNCGRRKKEVLVHSENCSVVVPASNSVESPYENYDTLASEDTVAPCEAVIMSDGALELQKRHNIKM
ncbi:hypothetical protein F2P81_020957 [Scophthalmus maximus]|uniref:Uncharacterized protein n=1 Tax=Scophthalmus maximus TaxID=52904 RepID=A0A6A4RS67_SCOMX|nr:hypothetical protein F2P81_025676 [Scophthalmus maximus]KAF0026220.1 hypothetical protein F2P81_020957 [Scophthalmus maximus]